MSISKTLIVTTGLDSYLMDTYLPSLYNRGKYKGDILIFDYGDLLQHSVQFLKEKKNIIYRKLSDKPLEGRCYSADRIIQFYKCLKENNLWKQYDIIMVTDGNDIEYYNDINPLFDIVKDKLCYVVETPNHLVKGWLRYTGFPDADKVWKGIKDYPMINAGMFIGPAKLVYEALEFMVEKMKYNSGFGADQLLINALVYYYKFPSQEIGYEWNYVLLTNVRRQVAPFKGKVYAKEDNRPIAILHRNGIGHMDYVKWMKMVFPACK